MKPQRQLVQKQHEIPMQHKNIIQILLKIKEIKLQLKNVNIFIQFPYKMVDKFIHFPITFVSHLFLKLHFHSCQGYILSLRANLFPKTVLIFTNLQYFILKILIFLQFLPINSLKEDLQQFKQKCRKFINQIECRTLCRNEQLSISKFCQVFDYLKGKTINIIKHSKIRNFILFNQLMNIKLSLAASNLLISIKEIQKETKEQFFTVKRPIRRVKHIKENFEETTSTYNSSQTDSEQPFSIIRKLQNLDVKELHQSLAETQDPDGLLEFKTVQPKKKRLAYRISSVQQINHYSNTKAAPNLSSPSTCAKTPTPTTSPDEAQLSYSPFSNIQITQFVQYSEQKEQKYNQYEHKNIIPRTIKTLFSNSVHEVQERQDNGHSIHDFKIINKIGQGTYSKVFSVVDKKTGFLCALKILQKKTIKELKVEENAIRQIKILSCLSSHPNVTTLYGSFSDQKFIYLILELCTDGDLYGKIEKMREIQKKTDLRNKGKRKQLQSKKMYEKVHILRQICSALKDLHEHSIMHRDVKPENIMVTLGNNIKLSDFGWSVYNSKNTLRRTLCGTPLYLAPEFITGCSYNDAVDIWSLGIMAFELFTGEFPFAIRSVNDLVKIVEDDIKFQKIKCLVARDFCQKALVKNMHYRADIWELYQHQIFHTYEIED